MDREWGCFSEEKKNRSATVGIAYQEKKNVFEHYEKTCKLHVKIQQFNLSLQIIEYKVMSG